MALFNLFKHKKGEEKKPAPKKVVKKEVKPSPVKEQAAVPLKSKKVLKWPHVTEKATDLTKVGQYIFNVYERANKPEIKKAVEDVYGVKVVSIKIIKIPPKRRRLGRIEGWRKAYKKAIVRLAQGQQIEILPR
ncbi:MAG: 50S ribosomal protein L23 [Parcubacteria group bacterium GW2011_GWF2_43_11]|nr:MAG: 50S ribosomal protein L23 [Parcubacteria group bacterium GW2011_GWF2_43_11]